MDKLGNCEFTVNDLVLYSSRYDGVTSNNIYQVIEVLPNKDGTFEDRPLIENYRIVDIKTKDEYLVYHSELKIKP